MTPHFPGATPMPIALLTTDKVESILRDAVAKDCFVEHDKSAGTAKAFCNGDLVFQAIQKGKGGPWICRFVKTEEVSWTGTTTG
jgi:hypothetical protein